LSFAAVSAITPPFRGPAEGLPWRRRKLKASASAYRAQLNCEHSRRRAHDYASARRIKESQMPKLKTKSGAKKRFKVTGTGKVLYQQSGKRHGMIKRSTKQVREHRGTKVLFKTDGDNIKKYWLPNH
jgi:large subunit ribosomal protein L35